MKTRYAGAGIELNIRKDLKNWFHNLPRWKKSKVQNLTLCIIFTSKSATLSNFQLKIWQNKKFLIQNLVFKKKFQIRLWVLKETIDSKFIFFEKILLQNGAFWASSKKTKNFLFLRSKLSRNVFLDVIFPQNPILKNVSPSKSVCSQNIDFKNRHDEKISTQNQTRCRYFNSNSDALWIFWFKIWLFNCFKALAWKWVI